MIWIDGTDAPVKFDIPAGFDRQTFAFPPKGKGIFSPSRVRFTGLKGDKANTLLTLRKEATQTRGTVTGTALFANDFWVAVKAKNGPLDGYAMGRPQGWPT